MGAPVPRRVRVLVVTTAYPTPSFLGGVYVREHARAAARHADVAVLHLERSHAHRGLPLVERIEDDEIPGWRVTYPWRPVGLSAGLHLAAAARGFRAARRAGFVPDLLHAHFFLAGIPAILAARRRRLPVVVSEHWSVFLPEDPMKLSPVLRQGAAFTFRNAAAVLPVSDALRRGIEAQGLHARRFEVVRNVVDTELFSTGTAPRNGRLLAVGLLYEAKGYDLLFAALAQLDVGLDIVGDGPLRAELEELARTLGIADRVRFHGMLSKAEVAEKMREGELFVLASRYDNNPCAALEALASGLPVVATAVGGVPELITDENGRLAPPQDADALAAEIRAALATPYDRAAIGEAARARYGADAIGMQLEPIYESVQR
jgi:glycosyltransferase involved in cell wall biosynthesis